jgi:hypothetical protein
VLPENLDKVALWWGPGVLILVVFAYGFLKLAQHWIDKSMELKREQTDSAFHIARDYVGQLANAQRSQAEALSRLAAAVEHRDSMESYEHQEMLIALKAVHREVLSLSGRAVAEEKVGK